MTKLSDAVNASNLDSYELARRSNVSEKRLNGYLSGRPGRIRLAGHL